MSAPKFTKWPWRFNPTVEHAGTISADLVGLRVAIICAPAAGRTEESDANAHLIAAAPELYSELEMLCNAIESEDGRDLTALPPEIEARIAWSRAALAKARGEA